jgi:hypothetical protein
MVRQRVHVGKSSCWRDRPDESRLRLA